MHDQLEVLEAENTKLKEDVKAAESLAEVLRVSFQYKSVFIGFFKYSQLCEISRTRDWEFDGL